MMLIAPMVKRVAGFLAKVFVLYLAFIVLWVDLVLFETASPRFFFEQRPLAQSVAFVLAIAVIISIVIRSKTPTIFMALCVAYSAVYFVFPRQAASFIAVFCGVAAVSFLYRNKITEPLLVMLPVITGAWIFICFVYLSYLVGWANYVTGRNDLASSIFEGVSAAKDQFVSTLIILPVVAMYFLGKHSYVRLYSIFKSLRK